MFPTSYFASSTSTAESVGTLNHDNFNSSTNTLRNFTMEEVMKVHFYSGLMIDRCVTPIWYLVGLVGNTISAVVWLNAKMRRNSSSAIYLAALSINDIIVLILHFLQELHFAWYLGVLDVPVLCEMYAIMFLTGQYLAPFLVFSFSLDRYVAICHPFIKYKFCNTSAAIKMVVLNILVGFSLCSIQGYFWTYSYENQKCMVRDEFIDESDGTSLWLKWTTISESIVFLFIPSLNAILNILVIHEIWKISGRSLTTVSNTSSKPSFSFQSSQRNPSSSSSSHQHQQSSLSLAPSDGHRKISQHHPVVCVNNSNGHNHSGYQQNHHHQQHQHQQQQQQHLLVKHSAAGSLSSSAACNQTSGSAAATNVMLLSVSFYVIFTTLPPAIIYSVENRFPDGSLENTSHEIIRNDPQWQRYFTYFYLRTIVYELCISHYACNFFLFLFTGRKFRAAVARTLRCRFWRSDDGEVNSAHGMGGYQVNHDNSFIHQQQAQILRNERPGD